MPITDQIMRRARRSERNAVETILTESFPAVYRMVHALTGEPRTASRIIRQILRDGVRIMPRWRSGITPENWFYHRALLMARQMAPVEVVAAYDPLLTAASGEVAPAYAAFVSAIRQLPRQQTEAYLLHHGEQFNSRLLGVTMDCSASAAVTHLAAASGTLQSLAGPSWPRVVIQLERVYQALTPPMTMIRAEVARQAQSALWLILLRQWARRLLALILLALLAAGGWQWRAELARCIEPLRTRMQSPSP